MRKTILALLTGGAAVAFCATGASAVTVLRGTDSETVGAAGKGVTVLRGGPATAAEDTQAATGVRQARFAISGGGTLWLIDARAGTLTACDVRGTSVAGKSRIHCAAGSLP